MANALADWWQKAQQGWDSAVQNRLGQMWALQNPQESSVMPGVNALAAREAMQADPRALLRGITWDSTVNDPLVGGFVGPAAIKVWHGSPHAFNKFEGGKVGSGQGAAMYGYGEGGYHAENKAVASGTEYMDPEGAYARLTGGMNNRQEFAHDLLSQGRNADDVFKAMKLKYGQWMSDAEIRAELDPMVKARGNLYEESLRWPDPAREASDPLGPQHFLDWDKPLSEQPAAVQKVFAAQQDKATRKVANALRKDFEENGPMHYPAKRFDEMLKEAQTYGGYGPTGYSVFDELAEAAPNSAAHIKALKNASGGFSPNDTGEQLYRTLATAGKESETSKALLKEGIPGIRYLDAGSRSAGEGTANYVVFSPDFVEILSRNGIPLK